MTKKAVSKFYILQNSFHVKSEWQKTLKFPHCVFTSVYSQMQCIVIQLVLSIAAYSVANYAYSNLFAFQIWP